MSSLASISLQFHHVKCNVGQMNAFEHFGGLQLPPGASVICLFRKGRSHAFQTRYCSGFIPVVLCRLFFEVQTVITSILSYSNNMLIPCAWPTKAIIIFHELTFSLMIMTKLRCRFFLVNGETDKIFGVVVSFL